MATRGFEKTTLSDLGNRIVDNRVSNSKGVGITQRLESTTLPSEPSKYRNVKCVVQGERFDSQREADVWLGLLARQSAGEISELRRQVRFPLLCPEFDAQGDVMPGNCLQVAEYVADFTYLEGGTLVVVDAKGRRISPYPLKKKWLFLQNGIEIREV